MSRRPVTLDAIEQGLADLARIIRLHGDYGLTFLPLFERLERERERLLDVEARLDRAIARAPLSQSPRPPRSDRPNSHIEAA